jgi:hypothetical protein
MGSRGSYCHVHGSVSTSSITSSSQLNCSRMDSRRSRTSRRTRSNPAGLAISWRPPDLDENRKVTPALRQQVRRIILDAMWHWLRRDSCRLSGSKATYRRSRRRLSSCDEDTTVSALLMVSDSLAVAKWIWVARPIIDDVCFEVVIIPGCCVGCRAIQLCSSPQPLADH